MLSCWGLCVFDPVLMSRSHDFHVRFLDSSNAETLELGKERPTWETDGQKLQLQLQSAANKAAGAETRCRKVSTFCALDTDSKNIWLWFKP